MDDDIFKLRIMAFSPETIPMGRLAEYMLNFANLMGSQEHVHFDRLLKGSTVLRVRVEQEDVPKVGARLALVNTVNAPADVMKHYKSMNDLLRADNARATLKRGRAQIIDFPGCTAKAIQRIGPVKESGQLEGKVIRVGGKDQTKHITLLGQGGEEYILSTRSIELAKDLAKYLFSYVRVTGMGTWFREENAHWVLDAFHVNECEPLEDQSLTEAVATLRGIDGDDWRKLADPLAAWHELRRN